MAKTIVQYKINGWLAENEEASTATVLNEIINRLEDAELVSVLPYQNTYEHSCTISPEENNSFVDIVTRLPSDCITDPFKSAVVIKNFVMRLWTMQCSLWNSKCTVPKKTFM